MRQKPRKEDYNLAEFNEQTLAEERNTISERITPKDPNITFVASVLALAFLLILNYFDEPVYDLFINEPIETGLVVGLIYLFALGVAFLLGEFTTGLPFVSKSVPVVSPEDERRLSELDEVLGDFKRYNFALESYEEALTNRKYFEHASSEMFWSPLRGTALENAVANFFSKLGWKIQFTPAVGDGGIDLIMIKNNQKVLVQCKGLKSKTGVSVVRDAAGVNSVQKPSEFIVISPNGFTSGSIEFAKKSKITLFDWKSLRNLARKKINEINNDKNPSGGQSATNVVYACTFCNQKLNIPSRRTGKITCPKCKNSWRI